jgi:Anti-sigma-K factor rskA
MRRILAIGTVAVALAYFLDPRYGRRRREAAVAWLVEAAQRLRERMTTPEEAPVEATGNGRPSVEEEAPAAAAPVEEPVVVGAAVPVPEQEPVPGAVAVEERPVAEAVLPPPLPPDVIETPMREPVAEEPEPESPAEAPPRRRRGWLIGGAVVLIAALAAAAGIAAWSFDVFDSDSNGEPNAAAAALNALAERQARAISILAQPGATRIPVAGAEESLLLVVGMDGDAVLIVSRLAQAPAGKAYEIWVISGKTPKPAGLFQAGKDTVVPLTRTVPKGATVALTLEPVGGSPRPTSKPLFAVTRS